MRPSLAAVLFLSSLATAQYEDTFDESNLDTWRFQFWGEQRDICSPHREYLYVNNNSLVFRGEIAYTACNGSSPEPAQFVWRNKQLFLFNDRKYLQRVYVDDSTRRVEIDDTYLSRVDPSDKRWAQWPIRSKYALFHNGLNRVQKCKEGCLEGMYAFKGSPPPNCSLGFVRVADTRGLIGGWRNDQKGLSASQAELNPDRDSLALSPGPDIPPAKRSSLVSGRYEETFDKDKKDTWRFRFVLANKNVCTKNDYLYAFNNSFMYRPVSVHSYCYRFREDPATFIWKNNNLYLYHKTHPQAVYVDPTTKKVSFKDAGPFKADFSKPGLWTGRDNLGDMVLQYDGAGFVICKESCTNVLYSEKAFGGIIPAHCQKIENHAFAHEGDSCYYF